MELRQKEIYVSLADPAFYQQYGNKVTSLKDELAKLESEQALLYVRWEELESRNTEN